MLTPDVDTVVDIRDLSFRWSRLAAPVLALDRLCIGRGERVFVEGPSGSGKSTLLSLLAGVVVPQGGVLEVLGERLDRSSGAWRDRFRADHVGYIFQMFNLIPYLSVLDNVCLPCRFSRARLSRAKRRSGDLAEEARRLLSHLDMAGEDRLARPVTELSVGQQQRVAAARALMGSPELLIADEPTSSLDADQREAFIRLLFDESEMSGATLIFVSHDASLEPLFDRSIRLVSINRAMAATDRSSSDVS